MDKTANIIDAREKRKKMRPDLKSRAMLAVAGLNVYTEQLLAELEKQDHRQQSKKSSGNI